MAWYLVKAKDNFTYTMALKCVQTILSMRTMLKIDLSFVWTMDYTGSTHDPVCSDDVQYRT
jgi:hypothetical protein